MSYPQFFGVGTVLENLISNEETQQTQDILVGRFRLEAGSLTGFSFLLHGHRFYLFYTLQSNIVNLRSLLINYNQFVSFSK
jgi:hypothetical protein